MKKSIDIIRVFIFFIAVTCFAPYVSLADNDFTIPHFILGINSCVWERERPGSFSYNPYIQDSASCEQYATGHGWVFTGSGADALVAANQEPNNACACGDATKKWAFSDSMAPYKCSGIGYSCTEPGSGCSWVHVGDSASGVSTSQECRLKAINSGGAYYGWNRKQAASSKPQWSCVCNESRTQWYSENNATTNWQFVCKAVKYECLAPPIMKPILPRKLLEPFNP
jgi:hypothetical protein